MSAAAETLSGLLLDLMRPLAIDLGMEPDFFATNHDRALWRLRLLRYPPHPGRFDGSLYGVAPHTDWGSVTLLAQDDVGGLDVRKRDGTWISVAPTPGAFVCNIGDSLMRWSNGAYVSTPHRVVNQSTRDRYSIAFFGSPNPDALIEALPSCVSADAPPAYPPIVYEDYLRERHAAVYPAAT